MLKIKLSGLKAAAAAIENQMNKVIAANAFENAVELHQDLVLATPIDTGYARSRWTISKTDPVDYPKMQYTVSHSKFFGIKVKPVSFEISNDAPYIEYLNKGHSKQAPSYFIEQTILRNGFQIDNKIVN